AALLAYAQAMVLWHRRHRYCGKCGTVCMSRDAGHERSCSNNDCGQTIFPRIDPAIIVLVEHEGRSLLGRQPAWPSGIYSTIAGFVEPGESLEDAVRREVAEETGVRVGTVCYHSSQPWPFPSSLMLGFCAEATDPAISLNDNELEEARWFSRADLQAGLRAGALRVPPQLSISSKLIAQWYDDQQPGLLAAIIDDITQS
ncbi:MAG: NAD(+) diphosphatase, partial [Gammaproteobacteria bacterium]|nr:NAD(+) diphosphatase [Gammaproteobacteria bacterium]